MQYSYNRGGFLSNLPKVTKNILIINVFMMIFTKLRPDFMYGMFALYYPTSPLFEWWQPITHIFMHGGWWHLFFNMFTLLMFGCTLERQWGPKKFLLFYFVTGLGAAAMHMGVMYLQMHHYMGIAAEGGVAAAEARAAIRTLTSLPMVGASGAIYGVLMGFAMLFPDTVMVLLFPPIPLKAKWWILIFVVIELFTGIFSLQESVAHFAHLGGMLLGWLMVKYWKSKGTMYQYEQ